MKIIFETERLIVRQLVASDIDGYYKLQSNPLVLKYAIGEVEPFEEIEMDLQRVIEKYDVAKNDFWIYAILRKSDDEFLGTVALVKDDYGDDELGYRFIEEYWGNGYGYEVCLGLIGYAKRSNLKKLVGYVVDENIASVRVLEKSNFKIVRKYIGAETKMPETKYELILE